MNTSRASAQPIASKAPAPGAGKTLHKGWFPIPHIQQERPKGSERGYVNGGYNCGPAVVAMFARGFNRMGHLSDARLIHELGQGILTPHGTSPQGIVNMLERVSVPPAGPALGANYGEGELQEHLRQGHKFIAQVESWDPQSRSRTAHYVMVRGMTAEGNYVISDPLRPKQHVMTPQQLRRAVGRAPPDGGLLIPVARPPPTAVDPQATQAAQARSNTPAALTQFANSVLTMAEQGSSSRESGGGAGETERQSDRQSHSFFGMANLFERVADRFVSRAGKCSNHFMARNEKRNNYSLDVDYTRGPEVQGAQSGPITPPHMKASDFVHRLLNLKRQGHPRAYELLAQLQASAFPRDQRVFDRVMAADLRQPGIGKKMLGDPG